jgi:hypothetical protein
MEIKHHNFKQLTPLPEELGNYLMTFKSISNMDDLYERVGPSNPDKERTQSIIYNYIQLLQIVPLQIQ